MQTAYLDLLASEGFWAPWAWNFHGGFKMPWQLPCPAASGCERGAHECLMYGQPLHYVCPMAAAKPLAALARHSSCESVPN